MAIFGTAAFSSSSSLAFGTVRRMLNAGGLRRNKKTSNTASTSPYSPAQKHGRFLDPRCSASRSRPSCCARGLSRHTYERPRHLAFTKYSYIQTRCFTSRRVIDISSTRHASFVTPASSSQARQALWIMRIIMRQHTSSRADSRRCLVCRD